MGRIYSRLVNIFVEIISFIILMIVLVISCTLLLLTGKFSAFAFRKRKDNTIPEVSEINVPIHSTMLA